MRGAAPIRVVIAALDAQIDETKRAKTTISTMIRAKRTGNAGVHPGHRGRAEQHDAGVSGGHVEVQQQQGACGVGGSESDAAGVR